MGRDRRAVERMRKTGESYGAALRAVRDEAQASRSARITVVLRAEAGWSEVELDWLEAYRGVLGFNTVDSQFKILGQIDAAEIMDDPNGGERLEIVLCVHPDVEEQVRNRQPVEVVLDDAGVRSLAKTMIDARKQPNPTR